MRMDNSTTTALLNGWPIASFSDRNRHWDGRGIVPGLVLEIIWSTSVSLDPSTHSLRWAEGADGLRPNALQRRDPGARPQTGSGVTAKSGACGSPNQTITLPASMRACGVGGDVVPGQGSVVSSSTKS